MRQSREKLSLPPPLLFPIREYQNVHETINVFYSEWRDEGGQGKVPFFNRKGPKPSAFQGIAFSHNCNSSNNLYNGLIWIHAKQSLESDWKNCRKKDVLYSYFLMHYIHCNTVLYHDVCGAILKKNSLFFYFNEYQKMYHAMSEMCYCVPI